MAANPYTTGLPGLDHVLKGLLPGDNVVWQVDSVEHYRSFLAPYCTAAQKSGKTVVYFRFAKHEPLLTEDCGAQICELHPDEGFEKFLSQIHGVLSSTRDYGAYVFDCLSDLAVDWHSDRMLGNFFRLTCPYVYEVEGLAYFALLKGWHSPSAVSMIADTTQILLDLYHHEGQTYVHPIKVQQRHSPTMYMLHEWEEDAFRPVTESATIARVLASIPYSGATALRQRLGVWTRAFLQAEEETEGIRPRGSRQHQKELKERLTRMLLSRDEKFLKLAAKYLEVRDILQIWRRMIGTGLIGGKSVGMLLARAILRHSDPRWERLLEQHDSFYIGSDVFYTYLVQNGCWWIREKQKNPATFLDGAEEGRRRILTGTFTPEVRNEFAAMLEYFGQSPIIVRSSSLLEDAFGNSFAGKYHSVFCGNQGSPEKRLDDFMSAVRTVYASTMSEEALRYRARRGILERDEQMSLLVQRVSGSMHGSLFYPQVAGVGLSYNPYAWNERIDPQAGMLRIVFGLGTRAVDRSDDDYTRVVALNAPELRPEAGEEEIRRYAQRKVDNLDLTSNRLVSRDFIDVVAENALQNLEMFATRDEELERLARDTGRGKVFSWILTFDRLLGETRLVQDLRDMLNTLEDAYGCAVDTEFTVNFFKTEGYKINLLQCRPLQVQVQTATAAPISDVPAEDVILRAGGVVVGQSRLSPLDRLIYVEPEAYGALPINDRYTVARLIGRLMHMVKPEEGLQVALLGPGRWGTTTPALGVPVSYAEISRAAAICEIVAMREGLVPDVSLGTHFFNELVEANILYFALFPHREGNELNESFFRETPSSLERLLPQAGPYAHILRVIDRDAIPNGRRIRVHADNANQRVLCFLSDESN